MGTPVPSARVTTVPAARQKTISEKDWEWKGRKHMPPTTFTSPSAFFLQMHMERWLRSKTSLTMYSRGILGSCALKMFLSITSRWLCSALPSFHMTGKVSMPVCSSCFA